MSGYRPPEWSQPALTVLTLTTSASGTAGQVDNLTSGPTGTIGSGQTVNDSSTITQVYVFDAVYRVTHSRRLRMTEHPVQSGASISDHAFIMPAKISLEIGMSDAMDAFTAGVFTTNSSKSVSAYQILVALQTGRQPLTLSTRLDTYTNLLIESIDAPDDKDTRYGLKATVVLSQIFTGTVTTQALSDRPQTSDETSIGAKQPLPISSSDLQRFTTTIPTSVYGAGTVSSVPSSGGS